MPEKFLPFHYARQAGSRFQVILRRSPGAAGDEVALDFLDSLFMAERLASARNLALRDGAATT